MRELDRAGQLAYIEAASERRSELQKQIGELSRQRAAHVAEARKELAEKEGASLGEAVNKVIDEQLQGVGYEVVEEKPKEEAAPEEGAGEAGRAGEKPAAEKPALRTQRKGLRSWRRRKQLKSGRQAAQSGARKTSVRP